MADKILFVMRQDQEVPKMAAEEIHVVRLDYFVGAKNTVDGDHILLKCPNASGEFPVAIQFDKVIRARRGVHLHVRPHMLWVFVLALMGSASAPAVCTRARKYQWKDGVGRARRAAQQGGPYLSCRPRDGR